MNLILLLGAIVVACSHEAKPRLSTHNYHQSNHALELSKDSGYVTKRVGLPFLIAHQLTDTIAPFWSDLRDSDTIAKYYKIRDTGHFLYCTLDYNSNFMFETHLILELNQASEILRVERYLHGNYICCWENCYEGFQKYGDYFGMKTCSTGSGFCASNLYLFKELMAQDSLEPVLIDYYEAMGGEDRNPRVMKSTLSLNNDELQVTYTLEEGILGTDDRFKTQTTKHYTLTYRRKGLRWFPQDSTLFKQDLLW